MKVQFRRFLVFWLASLIASVGSGMTSFGIGVYVFEMTNSAASKSLISLVAFLPTIIFSPFAGALADRFDRRLLMILGDGLSMIGVFLALFGIRQNFHPYLMIVIGVFVSAVFSALIEPASKATVTDLVDEEHYTQASGFFQLASSARFLIAPPLTTWVMNRWSIEGVLLLDLLTILTTIAAIFYIRLDIETKEVVEEEESILEIVKDGWTLIRDSPGLRSLVQFSMGLTFLVGIIQELSGPMILSFAQRDQLSMVLVLAASGMLLSSLVLAASEVKMDKFKLLVLALLSAGLAMIGFGLRENLWLITGSAFIFFAILPILNALLDYLVRVNVDSSQEGRIWGILGTLSQLGYVIAYAISGPLSDFVFRPLLVENGPLAGSLGRIIGVGSGRGIAALIILAGLILCLIAIRFKQKGGIEGLSFEARPDSHSTN